MGNDATSCIFKHSSHLQWSLCHLQEKKWVHKLVVKKQKKKWYSYSTQFCPCFTYLSGKVIHLGEHFSLNISGDVNFIKTLLQIRKVKSKHKQVRSFFCLDQLSISEDVLKSFFSQLVSVLRFRVCLLVATIETV